MKRLILICLIMASSMARGEETQSNKAANDSTVFYLMSYREWSDQEAIRLLNAQIPFVTEESEVQTEWNGFNYQIGRNLDGENLELSVPSEEE